MHHRCAFILLLLLLPLFVACGASEDAEYADRMAEEHATDTPEASPAAEAAPEAEVETERVTYATVDGEAVEGYLARPAGAESGLPAVIVIQEWWGLNENIEAMARRIAAEGYTALAVDLYHGSVAEDRDGAYALMQEAMANSERMDENLRQAYAYLEASGAPSIGSVGWCFGGGMSLRTAQLFPEQLDAAVIFYGRVETEEAKLAPISTPILGLFGSEDQGIPLEGVRRFESILQDLGKDVRIHVYEGADHAFANPSGTRYDAEAAEDAWEKVEAFFTEHLKTAA